MSLKLPDKWLWDFWFARDGADYHIFYLQAPRSLEREELRHWHATIGHAVSHDLTHWEVLPDALHPGRAGAWDDFTTWTGSVIKHEDAWHMLYTGTSHAEKGLVQRIGLATSNDLIRWQKHPANPLLEADPRWYELLDLNAWHDQAWRDPHVFRHPADGDFHCFITARANSGPPDGRGVIGYARSPDLVRWEVQPPLTYPGDFGELEIPQLVEIDGRYYVLFSSLTRSHSAWRRERTRLEPVSGSHYLVGEYPLGPFRFSSDNFLMGDPIGLFYGGKLVQGQDDQWYYLTWRHFSRRGRFLGDLIDPLPVTVDRWGDLFIDWQSIVEEDE
jgi:beta-fructofuranosidase